MHTYFMSRGSMYRLLDKKSTIVSWWYEQGQLDHWYMCKYDKVFVILRHNSIYSQISNNNSSILDCKPIGILKFYMSNLWLFSTHKLSLCCNVITISTSIVSSLRLCHEHKVYYHKVIQLNCLEFTAKYVKFLVHWFNACVYHGIKNNKILIITHGTSDEECLLNLARMVFGISLQLKIGRQ
jgi:hypothetical protein